LQTSFSKEIEKSRKLIYKGNYNKALENLEKLVKNKDLTKKDQLQSKLLFCRVLKLVHQHNRAYEFLESVLKKVSIKTEPLILFDAYNLNIDIFLLMGRYNEATSFINKVEMIIDDYREDYKKELVSREAYFNFVKGVAFRVKGHTKEAIQQMEISLGLWKKVDNKQEIARVLRNLGLIFSERGELDKAIDYLEQSSKTSLSIKNKMDSIHPLGYIAEIYYKKGEIDKTFLYYNQRLQLSKEANFNYGLFSSNFFLGYYYCTIGELDKSSEHLTLSKEMSEAASNWKFLGLSLGGFGYLHKVKGELEKSLEFFNEGIKVLEKIDSRQLIGELINSSGDIYLLKGNLTEALKIYKRSLMFFEEVGNIAWIISTQRNIGDVYSSKGDYDEALNYYKIALDYYIHKDSKIVVAQCLYNIGGVFWKKGDLDLAKDYLNQSLSNINEIDNKIITAKILLDLISINIDDFNLDQAMNLYKELDAIDKQLMNKLVNQQTRLANALILKNSESKRDHGKAEMLLEQITEEEILYYSLTVNALLNLCELIITRLRETSNEAILNNLDDLVEKLMGIAMQQQSMSLQAESYWLKYQLSLLKDLTLDEADMYLNKAYQLTKDYNLSNLANKFTSRKNTIEKNIAKIIVDDKKKKEISYTDVLDHLHILDSIKGMTKQSATNLSRAPVEEDSKFKPVFQFRI